MTAMKSEDIIEFRLYVAGELPNSRRAVGNLQAFCREHLGQRFRVEIIDVFEAPARALADRVLLTPQLVVHRSGRTVTIVGDLTDREALCAAADFAGGRP